MGNQKHIDKYILDHIEPEDAFLKELDRETTLNEVGPRMIWGN